MRGHRRPGRIPGVSGAAPQLPAGQGPFLRAGLESDVRPGHGDRPNGDEKCDDHVNYVGTVEREFGGDERGVGRVQDDVRLQHSEYGGE